MFNISDNATNARQVLFAKRKQLPVNSKEQFQPPQPSAYEPGGRGGLQPPQLQKFFKFFGQNADDSGKSAGEKTL